jgi:hypothetical protein
MSKRKGHPITRHYDSLAKPARHQKAVSRRLPVVIIRVIVRPDFFLALAAETTPPPRAPVGSPLRATTPPGGSRGRLLLRGFPFKAGGKGAK